MSGKNVIKEIHDRYTNNKVMERVAIAGLITEKAKSIANELVVVGGSAVEFYTAANYMTTDLDFVARNEHGLAELMHSLGFQLDDQYIWWHPDTSVIIEFPKAPLAGDINRVQTVETDYGTANVIGIEDIILDRLKGRVFWQDDNEWPEFMLCAHFDRVDFDYLRQEGKNELIEEAVEKMISDVIAYREGRSSLLRDNSYTDEELESKIMGRLENDEELQSVIIALCKDKQVPGRDRYAKLQNIKRIVKTSAEIQEWLADE